MIDLREKETAWAVAVTGTLTFAAMAFLVPLVKDSSVPAKVASAVVAGLSSVGLYKSLLALFVWVFSKSLWLRRRLLGKSFLEGTWVGHYERQGRDRFTIETIDQRTGDTVISGGEYDENGKAIAEWSSETALINERTRKLVYVYSCDRYASGNEHKGIGVFRLISRDGDPPNCLEGYSIDTLDSAKNTNTEFKLEDAPTDVVEIVVKAKERFGILPKQVAGAG
jgi:hypothetical protein